MAAKGDMLWAWAKDGNMLDNGECGGAVTALLKFALEKAKTMGIGFICIEGNINFYRHAGFDLASKLHIHYHCEPKDSEFPYKEKLVLPGQLG